MSWALGCVSMGSTVLGIPTVRMPRAWRACRKTASFSPRSPRHRVYLSLWPGADAFDGAVHLVNQGEHITRIARIALRHEVRKDKTGGRFCGEAGLPAKLRRTIALAFNNRGNGGIIGLDQFTVAELLALRQPYGLLTDVVMVVHRRGERKRETLALGLTQGDRVFEALFGLEPKGVDGFPQLQELMLGVTDQLHKTRPCPRQLRPKPRMTFFRACVRSRAWLGSWGGRLLHCCAMWAMSSSAFFAPLYRVVASVTRWLPCSVGKVSMTRWRD